MRPTLRLAWLRTHRWFALAVGWLLALQGLLGASLVVGRPLQAWAHPELFQAPASTPGAPSASLEAARANVLASVGRDADLTFRPPRDKDDTLWVLVRGPWAGTVYVDPSSGRELGRLGEADGFVNFVFRMHSSLWLGDTGKAILAWVALAYLLLLGSGLVLWWPRRWPPSLRVAWSAGSLRALFDLHRTTGAVMGLVIAVSVATGAYMAWRPLSEFVTTLAGSHSIKPPKLPKEGGVSPPALPIDTLVANAQAKFAGAPVGYVQVPGQRDRPVRVRLRLLDDPHPNGLTSVWLHPRTGAILAAVRWNELDPGARGFAVIYPLHTGQWGGPLLELVVATGGLALGGLGFTGLWLWWLRRSRRTAGATRPAT